MKTAERDKWMAVGLISFAVLMITTIGIPVTYIPVQPVPATEAQCLILFDSPPSAHFDVQFEIKTEKGTEQQAFENLSSGEAGHLLLTLAQMQQMHRNGFVPVVHTFEPGTATTEKVMYRTRDNKGEDYYVHFTSTTAAVSKDGLQWHPVETNFLIPSTLEEVRAEMEKGLWSKFNSSGTHVQVAAWLSDTHQITATLLARDAASLTCVPMRRSLVS